jgi:transposase
MALGKRKPVQQPLFVTTAQLNVRAHPFYDAVNRVLDSHHFDTFVQDRCAKFYDDGARGGRPGLAPGIYFRCLLIGYFEGIDSERGIDWRCNDSHSLKTFLGLAIDQSAPDHSTISRTRRLIDLETHQEVFQEILKFLANHGLIDGKTLGVDGTTLEANAAMRSIVRRDTGEGYQEFLTKLAKESGIETPTREDLARLDKKRKNKRTIIHAAGFNIGLLMRVSYGLRKPRSGSGVVRALILAAISGLERLGALVRFVPAAIRHFIAIFERSPVALAA